MNKIQICNWLLTRRCNLKCDYCRIVKNYKNQPVEYPSLNYYYRNEISCETIIEGLRRIKLHNPNCFHIFYGGEPILRFDLYKIINYCNENNIHYTIISNNTNKTQLLMEVLFDKVDYIEGFTASIDPIIYQNKNNDIFKKSFEGFKKLKEYSGKIKDRVAEITVTNENINYLYSLIKDLTEEGINSDITFIDISKNKYYDFSNVEDYSQLVTKNQNVRNIINEIIDSNLNVHMKEKLLPIIYNNLPSEFDCELEKDFHNMTIDADGSLRLCLRVKGYATASSFNILNILDEEGKINENINYFIQQDKTKYCEKCNWSCVMMSKLISEELDSSSNLVHDSIRKGNVI